MRPSECHLLMYEHGNIQLVLFEDEEVELVFSKWTVASHCFGRGPSYNIGHKNIHYHVY